MSDFHVFLSHNSLDKPAVEELARRLMKEGVEPWLDKWNLIPGDPWQEDLEQELAACACCAVFIGPSGISPWQNEEMRVAINRRVRSSQGRFRVIPVLLPGGRRDNRTPLPAFLEAATWVVFRHSLDEQDPFHRLMCGIRGIEPGPGPGQALYEGQCPSRGLQFPAGDYVRRQLTHLGLAPGESAQADPAAMLQPPFESYDGTEPFLFASYAHADSAQVYPELARLHGLGYRIWYDEGIEPGGEWPAAITRALRACAVFLVFVSPRAVASRPVRNAINLALGRDKPFRAVYFEPTELPEELELQMGAIQAIFRFQMPAERYHRLMEKALALLARR